jgi:hypothetical protein
MNGNTRIYVLMQREFDVNSLPRVPYVTEPPEDLSRRGLTDAGT